MAIHFDPEGNETKILHELVDFSGKNVIEIGCGDGRLTWRYAHMAASVLALDPKADAIAKAIEKTPDSLKPIVTFQADDITTLDLPTQAYDVAIFSWSI